MKVRPTPQGPMFLTASFVHLPPNRSHYMLSLYYPPVPPRHLLVSSSWEGGRVVSGVLGPYPEGADLTLSCQVTGGESPGCPDRSWEVTGREGKYFTSSLHNNVTSGNRQWICDKIYLHFQRAFGTKCFISPGTGWHVWTRLMSTNQITRPPSNGGTPK